MSKKKFTLPEQELKSMREIENQVDRVLSAKADFFSGASSARKISLSQISVNPNQPRKYFDREKLNELKQSLEQNGLLEPIAVRPINNNNFQIIFGERRYRAASEIGWTEIDAIIKNVDEKDSFEIALIENLQRDNLNPLEQAYAFQHLIDLQIVKNQSELAKRIGLTRQSVSYKMSLLSLPESVKKYLSTRVDKITEGHLRNFKDLPSENEMIKLAEKIVQDGLSVRETEDFIKMTASGISSSSDSRMSGSRTVRNPSKLFKIVEENRSQGLWLKPNPSDRKLIVEAKGVKPGMETDPAVMKALDNLFFSLFHRGDE